MSHLLTPLQLIAGASLLQNSGLAINAEFNSKLIEFNNLELIDVLHTALAGAPAVLSSAVLENLQTMAAPTCPALSDSIPQGSTLVPNVPYSGFVELIESKALFYLGSGDITKFIQALSISQAYINQVNVFLHSAINAYTYLANTFTNMDNLITGDVAGVNLATESFGNDLAKLGKLIDFRNLEDLGSPISLIRQLSKATKTVPALTRALILAGVPNNIIKENRASIIVSDSVQSSMYAAMLTIKGTDLEEILKILGVTTVGLETMADLLNPVKLFPNSFQSLTVTTNEGVRGIYINSAGTVNSKLTNLLPSYYMSSTS